MIACLAAHIIIALSNQGAPESVSPEVPSVLVKNGSQWVVKEALIEGDKASWLPVLTIPSDPMRPVRISGTKSGVAIWLVDDSNITTLKVYSISSGGKVSFSRTSNWGVGGQWLSETAFLLDEETEEVETRDGLKLIAKNARLPKWKDQHPEQYKGVDAFFAEIGDHAQLLFPGESGGLFADDFTRKTSGSGIFDAIEKRAAVFEILEGKSVVSLWSISPLRRLATLMTKKSVERANQAHDGGSVISETYMVLTGFNDALMVVDHEPGKERVELFRMKDGKLLSSVEALCS